MLHLSLNANELWEEIEPKISELRYKDGIDPVLADRFDSLINHYNGNLAGGNTESILGKLEALMNILSSKEYHSSRMHNSTEVNEYLKLREDFELLRTVMIKEMKEKVVVDEAVKAERLPNLDTDKVKEMYNYDKK